MFFLLSFFLYHYFCYSLHRTKELIWLHIIPSRLTGPWSIQILSSRHRSLLFLLLFSCPLSILTLLTSQVKERFLCITSLSLLPPIYSFLSPLSSRSPYPSSLISPPPPCSPSSLSSSLSSSLFSFLPSPSPHSLASSLLALLPFPLPLPPTKGCDM